MEFVWVAVGVGDADGLGIGFGAFGSGDACGFGAVKKGVKFTVPKLKSFL